MPSKKKLREIYSEFTENQVLVRKGNDVPGYMVHTDKHNANFFFGTKNQVQIEDGDFGTKTINEKTYIGKPQDHDGHILVVGGAGSGKSSCVVMPTLETWNGAIFAIDIKGELTAYWNSLKASHKRHAKIFNLTNISSDKNDTFASYDPFHFLRNDDKDNLVQNAKEIAQSIIPLSPDVRDPFWIQSAQNVLTGALLHGFGIDTSFNTTLTRVLNAPIWELVNEIANSDNSIAKLFISQFAGLKNPSENRMLTGISAELNSKVTTFVTSLRIKDVLGDTGNPASWEDLETHNIFMAIAEDKLGQWDGAISMMLTQLIRTLERRPDKQSPEGKDLPPILLLLDEFPRLGKVDVIQNAVSTLRSKGVTICVVIQSLAQLDKVYGKETRQIIIDNCSYKAILSVTDPDNQKVFSDMIGSVTVGLGGVSASSNKKSENYTITINETREPIVHPHELATLKDIVLMTPEGYCRMDKAPYYAKPDSFIANVSKAKKSRVGYTPSSS